MNVVVVFGDAEVAFCQQHKAVAWDVVFCDCLADDFFAAAVGVDVGLCCLELVERGKQGRGRHTVSQVLMPRS